MPAGNEPGAIRNGSDLDKTATGIGESGGKDNTWSMLASMSTVRTPDRNEEMVCFSRRISGRRHRAAKDLPAVPAEFGLKELTKPRPRASAG